MKLSLLLCTILIGTGIFAQSQKWRGENQDGRYPDKNLLDKWPDEGLKPVCTYEGMGEGYGSPSITKEGLFIAGMHDSIGYVYRFAHDGSLIWKTQYGLDFTYKYRGSRGTPTIDGDRVYYAGTYGDMVCLDVKDGNVKWQLNIFEKYNGQAIKWGYTESPLVYKDLVIVTPGGPDVSIVALNKLNGSVVWEMPLEGGFNTYCSPQLIKHNGKTIAMVNLSTYLTIFNPENGEVIYKHDISNKRNNFSMEPMYIDGKIFHTAGYGIGSTLYSINESTARLDTLYYTPEFDCKMSGLMKVGDLIYGTSDKKKQWTAIKWETGEIVYSSRDIQPGSLIMADGKFYIYSETGELALAKPTDKGFDIISRFSTTPEPVKLAFAHPVIYDGHIYVRFNDVVRKYNIKD